jgi:oxidase EvaA
MFYADNMKSLESFLDEAKQGFVVEKISLDQLPDWSFQDGALSHRTGGFFSVAGIKPDQPSDDERVLLYQPQSAITGLLTSICNGERYFLLQARAEPGTLCMAQFGPTIQSTPANYLRLHGGMASPYVDWFTTFKPTVRVLHDSMQLDLGERYLFKSKRLIVAECAIDVKVSPGFIWAPARLITQALGKSAFFNIDLRSLLNVCPWDVIGTHDLSPASDIVRKSLACAPRPAVFSQLLHAINGRPLPYRFMNIQSLVGWDITDVGLYDRRGQQGFDVEYFYVEARGREVRAWGQPLINSRSEGLASLSCRVNNGILEILVRIGRELGLQTGKALLPTLLQYPGRAHTPARQAEHFLMRTTESDEGGRFFCDASVYQLILEDTCQTEVEPDLMWVSVSELKHLLEHSNLCSIQLRGLASLLLGDLAF